MSRPSANTLLAQVIREEIEPENPLVQRSAAESAEFRFQLDRILATRQRLKVDAEEQAELIARASSIETSFSAERIKGLMLDTLTTDRSDSDREAKGQGPSSSSSIGKTRPEGHRQWWRNRWVIIAASALFILLAGLFRGGEEQGEPDADRHILSPTKAEFSNLWPQGLVESCHGFSWTFSALPRGGYFEVKVWDEKTSKVIHTERVLGQVFEPENDVISDFPSKIRWEVTAFPGAGLRPLGSASATVTLKSSPIDKSQN